MGDDIYSPDVLKDGQWVQRGMVKVWYPPPHIRLLRAVLAERYAEPATWFPSPPLSPRPPNPPPVYDNSQLTCAKRRRDMAADFDRLDKKVETA